MRLTIVTPLYPPDLGRLARYVKEVATRLRDEHEVTVISYGTLPESIPGVHIRTVSKNLPIPLRITMFAFRLWRETRESEVIYLSDGASVGWPTILVSWFRRIPVIRFVMQDEVWERAQPLKATTLAVEDYATVIDNKLALVQALQRWVFYKSSHILVPNETLKQLLIETKTTPEERVQVLPYPIDHPEVLPFSTERLPYQLLVTTTIETMATALPLLLAFKTLKVRFPDLQLIFTNAGMMTSVLEQEAQKIGVDAHVTCLRTVSHAEMWDLIRSSALLLVPTRDEHRSEPVAEALLLGTPVIALETSTYRSLIESGVSGLLLNDASDSASWITAIQTLLEQPALQEEFRLAGQQKIEHLVGWDQHLEKLLACAPSSMLSPDL